MGGTVVKPVNYTQAWSINVQALSWQDYWIYFFYLLIIWHYLWFSTGYSYISDVLITQLHCKVALRYINALEINCIMCISRSHYYMKIYPCLWPCLFILICCTILENKERKLSTRRRHGNKVWSARQQTMHVGRWMWYYKLPIQDVPDWSIEVTLTFKV